MKVDGYEVHVARRPGEEPEQQQDVVLSTGPNTGCTNPCLSRTNGDARVVCAYLLLPHPVRHHCRDVVPCARLCVA